ncbi:hypothetical protein [Haloechinothrix sp. LS1_15]|uniref:hypothetical protein n=1 Tax=Haloechinothrix sp. LS1_15 TaxID=2652248 RepID=UPI00294867EB|nr:hypothetical protein [Haloechinothrix sp. LS1_15]MDV6013309.1 hypothetical protein [Haloechinothrix sp. LS1_15]
MAHHAMVFRALISCPSDVDVEDIRAIQAAITRWNVLLGERFGAVVIPVQWNEHAAAAFGAPPQEIVNEQLVDTVDLAIAVMWTRLGSPTPEAESGTVEEINRISAAGKPVSILRCSRPVDWSALDARQLTRLDQYLSEIKGHALILKYADPGTLATQVDTVLTRLVTREPSGLAEYGGGGSLPSQRDGDDDKYEMPRGQSDGEPGDSASMTPT